MFLPILVKISEGEVTKTMRGIPGENNNGFQPLSVEPLEQFRQKFYRCTLSLAHPSAQFHLNCSSFQGDKPKNVFQHHYDIGVNPIDFLPTIITTD